MEKDKSGQEALKDLKKKTESVSKTVSEKAEKFASSSEAQGAASKASEAAQKASEAAQKASDAAQKSSESAKSFLGNISSKFSKSDSINRSKSKLGDFRDTVKEKLSQGGETLKSKVDEAARASTEKVSETAKKSGVIKHFEGVSKRFEGVSRVVASAKQTFREDILLQKPERKVYYTYKAPSDEDQFSDEKYDPNQQTGLAVKEDEKSAFSQHAENIASKVKGTEAYSKFTKVRSAAKKTAVGQKVSEAKVKLQDKMEDAREEWDTTQNPLIWKIRDVSDQMFSETEAGIAQTKIREQFPDFNLFEFLQFSHETLFPNMVTAYLAGDEKYIRAVCEGNAVRGLAATIRERESKKETWDTRILDMADVDFQSAGIDSKNRPVITVSTMCQHVHCVRSQKNQKIVDGGEADLRSTFYMLTVRPDPTCEHDLGWKVVEMQLQHVASLGV